MLAVLPRLGIWRNVCKKILCNRFWIKALFFIEDETQKNTKETDMLDGPSVKVRIVRNMEIMSSWKCYMLFQYVCHYSEKILFQHNFRLFIHLLHLLSTVLLLTQ